MTEGKKDAAFQKRLLAAATLKHRVHEARKSPIGLYKFLFTDEAGKPIVIKWFHKEWNDLVTQHRCVLIEASRELTKTSFVLAAILWIVGRNPNIRIKLLTETEDNGKKRLAFIDDMITRSDLYHMVFPNVVKDKNPKKSDTTTTIHLVRTIDTPEPTIESRGVTSAGTGGRADLIVMDDIVGASNTIKNPSMKPKVIQKVLSDWLGTLVANGRIWGIFSPWAHDDANAYFKKNTNWTYKRYTHGKPGNPYHTIFPERWPEKVLRKRRQWFGALLYARMYLCELISNTVNTVQPDHLRTYSAQELTTEKLQKAHAIVSMDPASGKELTKGKLDYIGITVLLFVDHTDLTLEERTKAWLPKFEIFVVDSFQIRLSTIQQAAFAWQLTRQWAAASLLVESHGMQSLSDWLSEQRSKDPTLVADIFPISFGSQSKGDRLLSITPLLNPPEGDPPWIYFHPRVVTDEPAPEIVRLADGSEHEILHNLREQILSFPAIAHDDIMDSLVQGVKWAVFTLTTGMGEDGDDMGNIEAADESLGFIAI